MRHLYLLLVLIFTVTSTLTLQAREWTRLEHKYKSEGLVSLEQVKKEIQGLIGDDTLVIMDLDYTTFRPKSVMLKPTYFYEDVELNTIFDGLLFSKF